MFKWIDYEQNSALFIEGIDTNVAILRYKDFRLHDNVTGQNIKMESTWLQEAKAEAENFLKEYWKNIHRDIGRYLEMLNK